MSGWRYPWAWRNCVGAWCPSRDRFRGSSRLTDQSTKHNNGTLTSMDPPNDWILSPGAGGGYALDFDNSNDRVSTSLVWPLNALWTAWVYRRSGAGADYVFVDFAASRGICIWTDTRLNAYYQGAAGYGHWQTLSTLPAVNQWTHIAVWMDASNTASVPLLWVDGAAQTVNVVSTPGSAAAAQATVQIGCASDGSSPFNGLMDDLRVYSGPSHANNSFIAQLYRLGRGGSYQLKRGAIVKAGAAAPATRNDNLLLLGVS